MVTVVYRLRGKEAKSKAVLQMAVVLETIKYFMTCGWGFVFLLLPMGEFDNKRHFRLSTTSS